MKGEERGSAKREERGSAKREEGEGIGARRDRSEKKRSER